MGGYYQGRYYQGQNRPLATHLHGKNDLGSKLYYQGHYQGHYQGCNTLTQPKAKGFGDIQSVKRNERKHS